MDGRGRKDCPNCNTEVGARTLFCACGFDFISAKKEKDAEKAQKKEEKKINKKVEEKISPMVKELMALPKYVAPQRHSPKDHAKRILSYGERRAKTLLALSRVHKYWSHVDWGEVEKGLVKV